MSLPLERRLVLALDTQDKETALDLYRRTQGAVGVYKVGLELFICEGPALVKRMIKGGAEVFLDLKLHDIPNTVRGAVQSAAKLGVTYLTLHALNGPQAIKAAMNGFLPQTLRCLADVPDRPTQTLMMEVTVACSGVVEHIAVTHHGDWTPEVAACVTGVLTHTPFPAHDLPNGEIFQFPLTFTAN